MIRVGTHDDLPALVELGKLLHQESSHSRHPFNEDKVATLLYTLVDDPNSLLMVAERNGEVIGGFAGGLTHIWYSDAIIGFDYSLFIRPEKRHGLTAIRLLIAFEEWARIMGACEIQLGITTGIRVQETGQLYESRGYTYTGPMYRKEVN